MTLEKKTEGREPLKIKRLRRQCAVTHDPASMTYVIHTPFVLRATRLFKFIQDGAEKVHGQQKKKGKR